jgi:protease-4
VQRECTLPFAYLRKGTGDDMEQNQNGNPNFYTNSYGMPPPFRPQPPKKRVVWPWVVLGGFVFFIVFLIIVAIALGSAAGSAGEGYPGDDYVAVLHIEGTIAAASDGYYSHSYVAEKILHFINDDNNKALLLYIDSPGGEIYAVDEIYQLLRAYKATGRKIYAYCATYAASGGYYLAATADIIGANRMSTVGSIGVTYGYHFDLTGLCEKMGIDVSAIASDENKSMGGYFSPMTDEQRAIFQSQLDEYQGIFIDVVAAGRPELSRAEVAALADGRTYTAKQAYANGLIDAVMTYSAFAAAVEADVGVENIRFVDYKYVYQGVDLIDLMNLLGKAETDPAAFMAFVEQLSKLKGPLVLYGI